MTYSRLRLSKEAKDKTRESDLQYSRLRHRIDGVYRLVWGREAMGFDLHDDATGEARAEWSWVLTLGKC